MANLPLEISQSMYDEPQEAPAVILIVDDEPAVCEVIAASLDGDFRVECAYSAEEALQSLATRRIDLALIDWLLPDRPGIEVAQRFVADGAQVIIMSGALDAED